MKILFTGLLFIGFFFAQATNSAYQKLCEVNQYWLQQKDVDLNSIPQNLLLTEKEWIRFHLMSVEKTLRNRNEDLLSAAQKLNREKCLDYLHQYWKEGNFPINEDYNYRTPIFIDKHDNFCAVGYLVKASGHENVSRMIAAKTNLAYVHEMKYAELFEWANENGFSVGELAWIQPQYAPDGVVLPLGGGFDTEVKDITVDSIHNKLYAIGPFVLCDYNVLTDMIAVMDLNTHAWTKVGNGLYWAFPSTNVNCITVYRNKVFVGGGSLVQAPWGNTDLTVVYWDIDSSKWFSSPGIIGEVKDFYVWDDTLYACGLFNTDISSLGSFTNVAKLSGNAWVNAGFNVNGHVNVLNEYKGDLVVAGAFDTASGTPVKNIFRYNRNNILPLANGIPTEIYDVGEIKDNLIAVGEACSATDTTDGIHIYNGSTWTQPWSPGLTPDANGETKFTCIEIKGDTFCISGYVGWGQYSPYCWVGSYSFHSGTSINYLPNFGYLDHGVNCMKYFNDRLYIGGRFTKQLTHASMSFSNLNSIGYCDFNNITAVKEIASDLSVSVYPNPATDQLNITIDESMVNAQLNIYNTTGALVQAVLLATGNTQLSTESLPAGIYIAEVKTKEASVKKRWVKM